MLTFYILLAAAGTALDFVIYRYVSMLPAKLLRIISMVMWGLIIVVAVIVIPHYFIRSKFIITNNEIASAGGFFTYKNNYMPISSIKSVSVIITPLGSVTGFNFAVINSLGARLLTCFLKKIDLMEISQRLNMLISSREKNL